MSRGDNKRTVVVNHKHSGSDANPHGGRGPDVAYYFEGFVALEDHTVFYPFWLTVLFAYSRKPGWGGFEMEGQAGQIVPEQHSDSASLAFGGSGGRALETAHTSDPGEFGLLPPG
jgi:hypothetical protein